MDVYKEIISTDSITIKTFEMAIDYFEIDKIKTLTVSFEINSYDCKQIRVAGNHLGRACGHEQVIQVCDGQDLCNVFGLIYMSVKAGQK